MGKHKYCVGNTKVTEQMSFSTEFHSL